MSRKKLKDPFDFMEVDPYKSLINILKIAPGHNKRLQTGLKTRELRYLLVRGYSANLGLHRERIFKGFRIYIYNEKKFKGKIQLDQEIAKSRQAFNNILKRVLKIGIIEKTKKNKWILSKKYETLIDRNEVIKQILDSNKDTSLCSFSGEDAYGYGIFFISDYFKNKIYDKYTREKFSHAIETIRKGRKELLEIIYNECWAIGFIFRETFIRSISNELDKKLIQFFTSFYSYPQVDRHANDGLNKFNRSMDYIDLVDNPIFSVDTQYLIYDPSSHTYSIKNNVEELAEIFQRFYYPSMEMGKIITMLDGHQFDVKISAFLARWKHYFLKILAIGDEITLVIPPPYFMADVPITLPKKQIGYKRGIFKFLDDERGLFDLLNYIEEEKDLDNIFDEYLRTISLNIMPEEINSELNKVRAFLHKDF